MEGESGEFRAAKTYRKGRAEADPPKAAVDVRAAFVGRKLVFFHMRMLPGAL